MSIESVMPSNHLILCLPLLLLPSVFPSIRVFSSESALCIRWPKYWSVSFSISPSNEYLRLISFRIDWFDLLAAQGTLKSLLQHHSSKASILRYSATFMVQLTSIGEGNGNPLQYSCLGNAKDRGAWWAAVYRATQSWTRLKRRSSSSSRNSHLSMTTRKSIALTVWTFVGKAMSLFFNMLFRLLITFLPRSKCLLIS